jgi:hypothetical protein
VGRRGGRRRLEPDCGVRRVAQFVRRNS